MCHEWRIRWLVVTIGRGIWKVVERPFRDVLGVVSGRDFVGFERRVEGDKMIYQEKRGDSEKSGGDFRKEKGAGEEGGGEGWVILAQPLVFRLFLYSVVCVR